MGLASPGAPQFGRRSPDPDPGVRERYTDPARDIRTVWIHIRSGEGPGVGLGLVQGRGQGPDRVRDAFQIHCCSTPTPTLYPGPIPKPVCGRTNGRSGRILQRCGVGFQPNDCAGQVGIQGEGCGVGAQGCGGSTKILHVRMCQLILWLGSSRRTRATHQDTRARTHTANPRPYHDGEHCWILVARSF